MPRVDIKKMYLLHKCQILLNTMASGICSRYQNIYFLVTGFLLFSGSWGTVWELNAASSKFQIEINYSFMTNVY